jgi:RNA polymerase subunit RPABC4/transcription elongation factor Spt4
MQKEEHIMGEAGTKGQDEVFCFSCGEIIRQEAEICPKCGVRQKPYSQRPMTGKSEIYCQSCGELIKAEAEICPKCGVRQKPIGNTAPDNGNGSNVFQYFVIGLKKFNKFSGRARRAEFWWFYLFIFIATWIIQLIANAMGIQTVGYFIQGVSLVPTFAAAWRRMHDIGKSGA